MSNTYHFTGRLADAPELKLNGDKAVAKFTLIRNEYAGKADNGDRKEVAVSIQFTAFDGLAKTIAEHNDKGDQLIVTAKLRNNNYERDGEMVYGYNFIVEDFDFGARTKKTAEAAAPVQSGKRK